MSSEDEAVPGVDPAGHARDDGRRPRVRAESGGTAAAPFGARLVAAQTAFGPLCVGLDPHPGLLAAWSLPDDTTGLAAFADACLAAIAGRVAVVKPQSAFFERHGSAGIAVLERLLGGFADTGTLVVLDAKRGDVGSTMAGYADAYLRQGAPLGADALTLSPYLGVGALASAIEVAAAAGRGVFLLARTSNPEGAPIQGAVAVDGRTVAQSVVDAAATLNGTGNGTATAEASEAPGSVGVVVGATADHGLDLSALPGPVLAPGLGAQGATPADVARRFADLSGPLLPTASRSVLAAGPDPTALRTAAQHLNDALAAA